MYLAGHRVVPSFGRIKQRRRTSTLWLRAMLRRGTLGLPRIYLHLHLHSHPLAISNGPAQKQKQQSSGGQSMLYVFLSICGQSSAALHCPSNLICKGLFGSTRCLPRLASHQRPELLLVHSSTALPTTHCSSAPSAQLQRPQQRARHSTRPRTGSGSGSGALPNLSSPLLLSLHSSPSAFFPLPFILSP